MLNVTGEDLKNSNWFSEIKSHIMLLLDGAKGYINTAVEICRESDGPSLYLDTLEKDMALVDNLINLINSDMEKFMRALKAFKAPRADTFKEEALDVGNDGCDTGICPIR